MINIKNLNKIYEGVIAETELTTKELNGYGFTSKDLTKLIEKGILKRKSRGHYIFLDVDSLFYYGKQLVAQKEHKKSTLCFQKCYALNPNHGGACFQLFFRAIRSKKYNEAFDYFPKIFNGDNPFYNADSKFYLYLLNIITEIPEEYRECARSISLNDVGIKSTDKRYDNIPMRNKIRALAIDQKFFSATRLSDELRNLHRRITIQDILIKTLLSQADEAQDKMKKDIKELARAKQYGRIVTYLEKIQERYQLNIADENTLFLAREILQIMETGRIPIPKGPATKMLFTEIQNRDYESALSLSADYLTKHNISFDDNAVYILLKDIVALIKEKAVTEDQVSPKEKVIFVEYAQEKNSPNKEDGVIFVEYNGMTEVEPYSAKDTRNSKSTFTDILDCLLKQDIDKAFQTLRAYLTEIGKRQYEFLIIDLIRISVLDKDSAFVKPMTALTYISRENFTFDITEYIQNFYEALSKNHFEEARIYLDIIVRSNELGKSPIKAQELERALNIKEQAFHHQNGEPMPEAIDSVIKKSVEKLQTCVDKQVSANNTSTSKNIQTPQHSNDDEALISSKLDTLRENGIVLLKPMDRERRHHIYKIVNAMPNVSCFSIGEGEFKQVVLRFRSVENTKQNIFEIDRDAKVAYEKGNYDLALVKYREIIELRDFVKPYYYAMIGLIYVKKNNVELAIDYLTVATKIRGSKYDFRDLIALLKGDILPEDRKPMVKMSTEDFKDDIDEYYGMNNIDEIADLISLGMSIDDVCIHLGLDEEQKATVCLILARKAFSQENYLIGDQYLKKAEGMKNKSPFVNRLLREIRKNKRFYKNRVPKGRIPLFLSLKFRKI